MVLLFWEFSIVVQLLVKLLDAICEIPILATRGPHKVRHSLGQLGQRELQSHWAVSEVTFIIKLDT